MGAHQAATRRDSHHTRWNPLRSHYLNHGDARRSSHTHQQSSRAASRDGLVNRDEFARFYREHHLGPDDPARIECAFHTFDRDGSGYLSLDELLAAAQLLNKNVNVQEPITSLVDSKNSTGKKESAFITPEDGRIIIRNLNRFHDTKADFDEIWSKLNVTNGQVRREEFLASISSSSTFVDCF